VILIVTASLNSGQNWLWSCCLRVSLSKILLGWGHGYDSSS
jgi:hypothetical protein